MKQSQNKQILVEKNEFYKNELLAQVIYVREDNCIVAEDKKTGVTLLHFKVLKKSKINLLKGDTFHKTKNSNQIYKIVRNKRIPIQYVFCQ